MRPEVVLLKTENPPSWFNRFSFRSGELPDDRVPLKTFDRAARRDTRLRRALCNVLPNYLLRIVPAVETRLAGAPLSANLDDELETVLQH